MRVGLRLPLGGARRWHLSMAEMLRQAGFAVAVEWREPRQSPPPGLDLLRFVEQRLFHIEPAAAGARINDIELAGYNITDAPPDVIIDCLEADGEAQGGPPVLRPDFGGGASSLALLSSLLDRHPPQIGWRRCGDGALLVGATTALVSPHVLSQGFDHALGRLATLAPKAVRAAFASADVLPADDRGYPATFPGARALTHLAREVAARLASRLTRSLKTQRQWNVGWRALPAGGGLADTGGIAGASFRWLPRDATRFVADPFVHVHNGRRAVFVEELPYATWRGYISAFEVDEQGAAGPLRPVLEAECHLSYPAVFEDSGVVWMIPETSARRTIELYRADPFPDRWVLDRVLIDNIDAADATFFRHDGLCWLAAATSDCGASSWDGLSLFFAETLFGPWRAHPLNPVICDPAIARPAGWLQTTARGLMRPAQDCVGGYGVALAVNRILRLDRETFAEERVARIAAPADWRADGLHTVNVGGGLEVIDAIV